MRGEGMPGFNRQLWEVFSGNGLLFICSMFYLAWWTLVFRPGAQSSTAGTICITLAFITGIAGLILILVGLNEKTAGYASFSNWMIIAGGIAAYLVLLLVTKFAFGRTVTSELLIFTGWVVLELSTANELYGIGRIGAGLNAFLWLMIFILFAVCLVCYILYYRLDAAKGWIDGMIPLISAGAGIAVMMCAEAFSKGRIS